MDFSPASIEYAREQALAAGQDITYELADIREYKAAGSYDAVLILFGEINVFSRGDAAAILRRACSALKPGGLLFLEAHVFTEVKRQGLMPPSWQSFENGLFSPRPHLCLSECFWDDASATASTRYFVVDAESAECTGYASSMSAYSDAEYEKLLSDSGFGRIESVDDSLWPVGADFTSKLQLLLCHKA